MCVCKVLTQNLAHRKHSIVGAIKIPLSERQGSTKYMHLKRFQITNNSLK